MKAYSLQRRLVFAVAALTTIMIAVLGVAMYGGAKRGAWQQFDEGLRARAQAICLIAEHDEDGYEMDVPDLPGTFITAKLPDGQIISSKHPTITAPHSITTSCMPRDESGGARPIVVTLTETSAQVTEAIDSVQRWFSLVAVFAVLATTGIAFVLVRRALTPLPLLAHAIGKIDDKSLDQRLPVRGQPAELVAPVHKLNDLLGRLDASFTRERQFTADVSHELRTPIAALRTRLEVTALSDRTTDEYKEALAQAEAIVLQLQALVENLLQLARLDAGQVPLSPTEFDLGELIAECWKPLATMATERKLELRTSIDRRLTADREKLRSVIANLLSNAAEYTDRGGWVEVSSNGDTIIAVTDSGPTIPEDQMAKLFDRLWRGDAARASTGVHCGIGLALAKSLCAAMSLELTAESAKTVRFAVVRR